MLALAADPPQRHDLHPSPRLDADEFAAPRSLSGRATDDDEAVHFAAAARAAGVPVNVIDKPAFCDFSFGAIVNRSPLVIGISTDGAAPVFAQAIRAKLEALIPRGFAHWAEAARRWRSAVKASGLSFRAAPLLADVHRACGRAIPTASRRPADYRSAARDGTGDGAARTKARSPWSVRVPAIRNS